MMTVENSKYTYSHPIFVGKPTWEWDFDDSAKYLVSSILFLLFGIALFFLCHYLSIAEGIQLGIFIFWLRVAAILSIVIFALAGFLSVYLMFEDGSLPHFGHFLAYKSYNVHMTIDSDKLCILMGEDLDAEVVWWRYAWTCPWECLADIQFAKNKKLGAITMTAKSLRKDPSPHVRPLGGWHYSEERFGTPLMPNEQVEIFGGRNTIILHLSEATANKVFAALDRFSPGHVDTIAS